MGHLCIIWLSTINFRFLIFCCGRSSSLTQQEKSPQRAAAWLPLAPWRLKAATVSGSRLTGGITRHASRKVGLPAGHFRLILSDQNNTTCFMEPNLLSGLSKQFQFELLLSCKLPTNLVTCQLWPLHCIYALINSGWRHFLCSCVFFNIIYTQVQRVSARPDRFELFWSANALTCTGDF